MALTPEWADKNDVKPYIKNCVGMSLTDAEIDEMLIDSEGFWKAYLKVQDVTFSEDNELHRALRKLVILEVAMQCLQSCSQSCYTIQYAILSLNQLSDAYNFIRDKMNQKDVVDVIAGR